MPLWENASIFRSFRNNAIAKIFGKCCNFDVSSRGFVLVNIEYLLEALGRAQDGPSDLILAGQISNRDLHSTLKYHRSMRMNLYQIESR